MTDSDRTLHLVIAEESLNDAERLVSVLRNTGLAVRPTSATDVEALENALHGRPQDILLCAPGLSELPLESALRTVRQSGHDLGVLVLTDDEDAELRREVMAMGASDLVSKADSEHFRQVVMRELAAVDNRRGQRRLRAALQETERRCETLLDSSRDAIAYVHEGMHIYANQAYLERFEVAQLEDIQGLPLLDLIAPVSQAAFREVFRQYTRGKALEAETETRIRTETGEECDVHLTLATGSWDGEQATQILIRENDQAELAEQLEHLSRQDMLTGLYNRNHFLERVAHLLSAGQAEATGAQHGLLYLQLDHVETIQENLGISAIDRIVADTGELLGQQIGDHALAARYADALFAVCLPNTKVHDALGVAESIRQALEAHISDTGTRTVTKSASIGVAMVGDNVATAEEAVNIAASASKQAALEGGNRVQLYAMAEDDASAGSDWQARIEEAIADNLITCLYQPIVALHGSETERYELFAYLEDDTGRVEHAELRAQAERVGVSAALERHLLRAGLQALAASKSGRPVLFVTVSSASLGDSDLTAGIRQQLIETGVHGSQLVIQIPEPVAVTQLTDARLLAQGMRGIGGGCCLTAYGSGLDSFRLLGELPVDFLSLDQTLVEELDKADGSAERIGDIITNAHDHEQQVIASGLNGAGELAQLWQLGIDLVQGGFLQSPTPTMDYDFSGMVI